MSDPVQDILLIEGVGEMQPVVESIDYSVMLTEFRYEVAEEKDAMFTNQATVFGDPWEGLKQVTKDKKGFSVILVDTGRLRSSLADVGGEDNFTAIMPHGMIYGTDVEYATFHVTGTKNMPKRDITGISDELIDKLSDRISTVTAEKVGKELVDDIDPTDWIRRG